MRVWSVCSIRDPHSDESCVTAFPPAAAGKPCLRVSSPASLVLLSGNGLQEREELIVGELAGVVLQTLGIDLANKGPHGIGAMNSQLTQAGLAAQ